MSNYKGITQSRSGQVTVEGDMDTELTIMGFGEEEVRMAIAQPGGSNAYIYIDPRKVRLALDVALGEAELPTASAFEEGDRVALTGPHVYRNPEELDATHPAPSNWLGTVVNPKDTDGDVVVRWDEPHDVPYAYYSRYVKPSSLTKVNHDFRIGDRVVVGYDGPFFDLAGEFATIVGGPRGGGFELDVQPEKKELRWRLDAESGIKGWGQPASNLTMPDGVEGVRLAAGDVLVLNENAGMYGTPGARAIYLRDCEHDDELIFVRFIRDGRQGHLNGSEEAVLRVRFDRGDLDERAANALIRQTLSV